MSTSPPVFLLRLIDDAAIFPPGNSSIPDAVTAHLALESKPRRAAVGPFVVDGARVGAANTEAARHDGQLDISLVVRDSSTLGTALSHASHRSHVRLTAVEVALDTSGGELVQELAKVTDAVDALDPRPDVWIELAGGCDDTGADLSAIARAGFALKIRTGGLSADAFPAPDVLARLISEAARLELPFKCTAGLHSPLRHHDPAVGATRHGFINILLAAVRARVGASCAELTTILESEDACILVTAMKMISDDEMRHARDFFRSYGSCSIDEPLIELVSLGLLDEGMLR